MFEPRLKLPPLLRYWSPEKGLARKCTRVMRFGFLVAAKPETNAVPSYPIWYLQVRVLRESLVLRCLVIACGSLFSLFPL